MNTKYNACLLIGLLLTGGIIKLHAQTERQRAEQLESSARQMAELSTMIAENVTAALVEIDFNVLIRESEQLVRTSAVEARNAAQLAQREIEAIDWDEVHHELAVAQAEIANMAPSGLPGQWTRVEVAPYQEEKVIEKVYQAGSGDKLSIDNRYGRIKVNNWNRNEFKVVVRVKVGESSSRRAQEALDRVTISDSKSGSDVQFKTSIASAESGWFSSMTGSRNQELSVNYEVYMPAANELCLTNRYGPIEIGDRDGKLDVSVRYGSLKTGKLNAPDNTVSASYSKVDIASAKEATIDVKYGGLALGEIGKATISLSYSGNGKIRAVTESADVSLRYSSGLYIGLGPGIKEANIAASYSSVVVSPAKDAAFDFNADVSYGKFDYGPDAIVRESAGGNTSKQYTGYWNRASASNSVNISARYGSVTLK